MDPKQETPDDHCRARTAAKALGAAAAIAPLLAAGSHADDAQAKTFKVKNTKANGKGTLNKQIKRANRHQGSDRIIFRSRLSGSIKARRGNKRRLEVTDPVKIVGPGTRRLALKGATKGSDLRFNGSGASVLRGLKLKAVAVDVSSTSSDADLRITRSKLSGKGIASAGVRATGDYSSDLRISRSTIQGFSRGVAMSGPATGRIDRSPDQRQHGSRGHRHRLLR